MADDETGQVEEAEAATDEESAAVDTDAAEAAAGGESAVETDSAEQNFSPDELHEKSPQAAGPPADINLDLVLEVPVNVSLRVGSTDITIRDLVQLVEGSVVALDRESTEPLDVLVNGTLIAHGEIVVVDGAFGVRLTDVVSPAERIRNIN